MKNLVKFRIRQASIFLSQAVPVMILAGILFFGAATIGFQHDNKVLLEQTKTAAENTERIIKDLEVAVGELKADNERQTRLISCLLAEHGLNEQVSPEVQAQCGEMASRIHIEDVTRDADGNQPTPQPSPSPSPPPVAQALTPPPPNPPPASQPENILPFVEECVLGLELLGGCL